MADIFALILKCWGYGIPVTFIVTGITAALNQHDYSEIIDIFNRSVLWPIFLIEWLYGWLETVTIRPWYYLCVIWLAISTSFLFYVLSEVWPAV